MDNAQLAAVIDYMTGGRVVGGTVEEPAETPHSPELRAFIVARLGESAPHAGYGPVFHRKHNEAFAQQAKALAALLREIADGIDPAEAA